MDEHRSSRWPSLELWAGIECTHNRVGDTFFDQVSFTTHASRPDDLKRFADLGIQTLRYPALWEWAAPRHPSQQDWTWADERLPRLKALGIRPILGLVHHGSGPAYTNLLDPEFPVRLACYARALAQRFPWVLDFTPVNEPLTTARFSALYGVWYPHLRSDLAFVKAILNQCRATILAMREIRTVIPKARLVQTEDIGFVHSTPALRYQADFENARKWLTFDLLTGQVAPQHPLTHYFGWLGIESDELQWFRKNPCPPDILGINYYVTSERFLDENCLRYPPRYRGGNAHQDYCDVEAVRVRPEGLRGPSAILQEAWRRYRLPLAITEAHLSCSREEQLRWLYYTWREAQAARRQGADVRAVTAWSLLGAYDWHNLVTVPEGRYESGVFDVRFAAPRPTALALLVKQLASGHAPSHPVLQQPGWWKRETRLLRGAAISAVKPSGRPILIAGGRGTLGTAFGRVCAHRFISWRTVNRDEMDISDSGAILAAIEKYNPWAIVNAAGYVRVDDAEFDRQRCWRENVTGPNMLAYACRHAGIPLMTFSTDLVFDGNQRHPYCEKDNVNPLGVYGRTKAEAERRVLGLYDRALVIRTSAFFGPWDDHNFVSTTIRALECQGSASALETVVSPTYVPDLVHSCLDLLLDGACGVWHVTSDGQATWSELGRAAAAYLGFDTALVQGCSAEQLGLQAPRPAFSALATRQGLQLPDWQNALARYFAERADAPASIATV